MQKILNLVKTTLTDATNDDLVHQNQTDMESNIKMANAKKRWLLDYQVDREKKRELVRKEVTSKGIDPEKVT